MNMIIYYVNRFSNIRSPFDITDACRNKIMKVGDVCIREDENGISFLLITSSANSWKACRRVNYALGRLDLEGNTLLFSFDGTSKRCGRIDMCMSLCKLFEEDSLRSFFSNAVDILSYKCDMWDVSVFSQMLGRTSIESVSLIQKSRAEEELHTTLFETYLPQECKMLFKTMISEGCSIKEIYKNIRSMYPNDFRQAMKRFLIDNPQSTIYDK